MQRSPTLVLGALALASLACTERKASSPPPSGDRVEEAKDAKPYLDDLPGLRERGRLRIIVYGQAPSFMPRMGNPALQDEAMAEDFAEALGLDPVFVVIDEQSDLIPALLAGRGDLIAAQLTVTPDRAERVAFSRGRLSVEELLVGPATAEPVDGFEELDGMEVHVRRASSYADTLLELEKAKAIDIDLRWAPDDRSTVDLLMDVSEGKIPATAADSNLLRSVMALEAELSTVATLAEGRELAWAVRPQDTKLRAAVDRFVLERALTRHDVAPYVVDLPGLREKGVLRVLTRNNPVSYFLHRGRQFGFDYHLMKRFAQQQGLRLQMEVVPSRDDLEPWLLEGRGDVVAATLTATPERRERVRFSEPYLYSDEVVVKRAGTPPVDGLDGRTLHVRASSSYAESLERLKASGVDLTIERVDETLETERIADRVARGEIELTVMDSFLLDVELAYGQPLEVAMTLPRPGKSDDDEGRPIGFAVHPDNVELAQALDAYVSESYRGLHYNIAKKRYFEDRRRIAKAKQGRTGKTGRLSPYDEVIRKYARQYGLDWRLMAAQAYVESQFDPRAKSWGGAEGLFQVMPRTGKSLGFENLEDPSQGTHAGIKYMDRLISRFDSSIPLEERVWFAMAAYNAGLGHVYDARRLAPRLGKDPDRWFGNVEQAMLRLAEPRYARKARHGYCRGGQPVAYVSHIRELYEAYVEVADL
jgi:membrane-bound lytic murein transglycosylase F